MISLTKDEFLNRWHEKRSLFALALEHDASEFHATLTIKPGQTDVILPSEVMGEFVWKTLNHLIDLVYDETL